MVLAVPVDPKRRRRDLAVLAGHRRVGLLGLKIGGGRVEEQQVDLEVQQVGDLEVHLLAELLLHLEQPVHRPIARVLIELCEPVDPRPLAHPLARRELRQRLKRPVGDHREQDPLRASVQPPALQQPGERPIDPQCAPQAVKRPRAAHRP